MDSILLVLVAVTISAIVLAMFYTLNHDKLLIWERLNIYTAEAEKNNLPPELSRPFRERIGLFLKQRFNRLTGRVPHHKREIYQKRLITAGNPHGLDAESFIALKYITLVVLGSLGIFSHRLLYFIAFIILGLVIPDLYLKSQERRRKDLILKSLPDILDLLSVSVEAGLSFDAALQKVTEKSPGPLTEEFTKTLQELNLGKSRRESLRDMADRIDVDDVSTFLGSIIQADQLGVSITNVLRLQSRQVRHNRRMQAEEKAQKAPIKILLPLLFFIFPTILIVLLGPAVIQLMDTL